MSNAAPSENWWRCVACGGLVERAIRPIRCPDCREFGTLRATDERPKPRVAPAPSTASTASSLRDANGRFLPRAAIPRTPQRIVAVPPRPALAAAPPPIEISTTLPPERAPEPEVKIEPTAIAPTEPDESSPEEEEDRVYRASEVEDEVYVRVPTGSAAFDHYLGGGACVGHTYVFAGAPGIGKCLGRGTPVLLYDGSIKPVEEIRIGDQLMGPDSEPRRVLSTTVGRGSLYKVRPVKGDPWICNDAHVLTLTGTRDHRGQTIDTALIDHIRKIRTKGRERDRLDRDWKLFRVPVIFPEQDVAVEPYLVGLWIGDGTFKTATITNGEPEIHGYCKKIAPKYGCNVRIRPDPRNHAVDILFSKKSSCSRNTLRTFFRKECSSSGKKRIPSNYLINNESTRLALLAGILDTDGYLTFGTYELTTVSAQLRDQYLFLARSLGFAAYASKKIGTIKSRGFSGVYWRICISGDVDRIPCKVKRRKAKPRKQIKRHLVTGFDAQPIGDGDYYGFTLDGDGRFLLGDFTVTHNTTRLVEAAACIAAQQGWLALYVCGEEPKEDVKRTLRESGVFDRYPNAADNFCLYETQDPDRAVERADEIGAKIVVVDSMSVMRSLLSSPGEDAQYKYAATAFFRRSKASGPHKGKEKIIVMGVGQVNQDGGMSGPNKAVHWISFAGMVEIVDSTTLLPVEDQTRPTGTTGWRVFKGKSRGSSNTRTCYFDRDDETGIVTERPAGTRPGMIPPAPKPRPDRVVQRAPGLQEAPPDNA